MITFNDQAEGNPCSECSAPCCRMLLIPHPVPSTFMELDYIRYMLGFPSVRMVLNSTGKWQVQVEETCGFLDEETSRCTVHGTARKPKTCAFFNPYQCWYKRNFETTDPPEIIHIDLAALEALLPHIGFDGDGNVIEIPSWEKTRDLVRKARQLPTNGSTGAAAVEAEADVDPAEPAG